MASIVKFLKLLSDATRMRILHLLRRAELSVAELQEILSMGQSRISAQLSQLKGAGLIADRRSGKNIFYRYRAPRGEGAGAMAGVLERIEEAWGEMGEVASDEAALALALRKRSDKARAYFDELAGKFGRSYCPGRSWKGLAETLLKLMPPLVIADLGAGEGTFSQLLAQRAERVIAVDISPKMVEFGSKLAEKHGYGNLEYRLGDIEDPPLEDGSVDIAFFSQSLHHAARPEVAIEAGYRIVKPGGRIVILDLLKHGFEDARELYADVWLGFSELEISELLEGAGFERVEISLVDREEEAPHFQTLLAIGEKV